MNALLSTAEALTRAGLSVIPIGSLTDKSPAGALLPRQFPGTSNLDTTWKPYQERLPTAEELRAWFGNAPGLAVVGGMVSGGLTILDFDVKDGGAGLYEQFAAEVDELMPGLLARLPLVESPSGGRHVYLRCSVCEQPDKLARSPQGKTWIETKGQGGYCLAPRTDGYQTLRGSITQVPVITPEERALLLTICRSYNGFVQGKGPHLDTDSKPGAVFNAKMTLDDMEGWLGEAGWHAVKTRHDGTRLLTRPGKRHGLSATLGQGGLRSLYVFSSNAAPFESETGYSAFGVYTLLKHGGDYGSAARELLRSGYGGKPYQQETPPPQAEEEAPNPEPAWFVEPVRYAPEVLDPTLLLAPTLVDLVVQMAGLAHWPVEFLAAPLLSLVGACIGTTRRVAIHDLWREFPIIWTCVVGESGSGKTPALDNITRPFYALQREWYQTWKEEMAAYEAELTNWEAAKKEYRGEKPKPPKQRKGLVSNITLERLIGILDENPRGVLLEKDELIGWVGSFNQYKKNGGSDRQEWLSMWSAKDFTVDRKGDGYSVYVHNPFVAVAGGIQPNHVRTIHGGPDDGLPHRLLFFWPDAHPQPIEKVQIPEELLARYRALLERLMALQSGINEDGESFPISVPLSQEAFEELSRRDWAVQQLRKDQQSPQAYRNALAKMASHASRIALTLYEAQRADGIMLGDAINLETMAAAWSIAECSISHLRRVFGEGEKHSNDERAERALAWIRANGGTATARELVSNHVVGLRTSTEAQGLLRDLADRHFGTVTETRKVGGTQVRFTLPGVKHA